MRYCFFNKNRCVGVSSTLFLVSMFLLLLGAITLCIPTSADGDVYDNVIRFHVIAQSDTEEDQALKLALRDAVIAEYSELLSNYDSKEEAYQSISRMTSEINAFCENFLVECGYDYDCTTIIDNEYYNRTYYESFHMPEGYYTSLRIIIGEGEGKNWWCVLFPPMCTKAAMNTITDEEFEQEFIEAGFTGEQYRIITETDKPKYKVKFRLLELLFGR